MPCALPPLDQTEVVVGRGYGLGYNRERTRTDQLHGGMDFVASTGTPVLAPIPGTVDFVSRDTGSRITADAARSGRAGQVRRMGGYGNAVVLRHDFAVAGLPTPFWTSYNHLSAVGPGVVPGAAVATGQLLGNVGNTTNGQFRGMGAHLHMEVRRAAFPGPVGRDSYELDTVDPSILFAALGIDWLDSRREVGRGVGGHLFVRADGPSGPAACGATTGVRGFGAVPCGPCAARARPRGHFLYIPGIGIPGVPLLGLAAPPPGYVDPLIVKSKYTRYGSTQVPRPGSPAADVMPPEYAPEVEAAGGSGGSGGGSGTAIGVAVAAAIVVAGLRKKR